MQCCHSTKLKNTDKEEDFSKDYWKLGLCAVLAGQLMMISLGINIANLNATNPAFIYIHGLMIVATLAVILLLGKPLLKTTFKQLGEGVLALESLFSLSLIGAFLCSLYSTVSGEGPIYYEVVAIVCLIYTIGKMITRYSKKKVYAAIEKLKNVFGYAYIYKAGKREKVDLCTLSVGTVVSVIGGDPITVDGVIIEGRGFVMTTYLTGDSTPTIKEPGNTVSAGSYSVDGVFLIRSTHLIGERQIDKVLDTVEHASEHPSKIHLYANQLMQWFVPIVMSISLITFGYWLSIDSLAKALLHSMSVLLVACPCALGLATPIALYMGLWKLSQLGLISKKATILDSLGHATHLIFDKTGTLTQDIITIKEWAILTSTWDSDRLKAVIAKIEHHHNHPLARAFDSLVVEENNYRLVDTKVIPGMGIEATIYDDKHTYIFQIGILALMSEYAQKIFQEKTQYTSEKSIKPVYVTIDQQPICIVYLEEVLRPDTLQVLKQLENMGLEVSILTGDASTSNLSYLSENNRKIVRGLTPLQKKEYVQTIKSNPKNTVIFIGDGLNDSPAMSACDGSIAFAHGAELTQVSALAIIPTETLAPLPQAISVARNIIQTTKTNFYFAISYNTIGIMLAATGYLTPVIAALVMVVSSIFVSVRAARSTL